MRARMRLVMLTTLLVLSGIEVGMCGTLELIVSDSGRNESWSPRLRIGDAFNVQGADGKLLGGIMAGTAPIQQVLVPMPRGNELEKMSQGQENAWVRGLSAVLIDRVHIATTNEATLFEIRLLQETPRPSNANMAWEENAHTDRFARMSYRAIGELLKDLREREQTCRITAAMADSGCGAFARAAGQWKRYADSFRRVDLVDGRASLAETRPMLSTLNSTQVRLFVTEGSVTPAMSIGRIEVACRLLVEHPDLTIYAIEHKEGGADQTRIAASWTKCLSGRTLCSVTRLRYSGNRIVESRIDKTVTAQEFREPISGWDPVGPHFDAADSLKPLGIVTPASNQGIIPVLQEAVNTGFSLGTYYDAGHSSSRAGLPARDLQRAIDLSKLNEAAYRSDRMEPFGNVSEGLWEWKQSGYMDSGLNWTLFERKNPNGRIEQVLAFAGTEIRDRTRGGMIDLRDWLTNFHQELYTGFRGEPLPAQYRDAMKVAESFIRVADRDKNTSIVLTGHSLGGALAQFVSLHTGVKAYVFNSAPLGLGGGTKSYRDPTLFGEITQQRVELAEANIVNIHLRGDGVHEIWGEQLGRQYMIDPAPGTGVNPNYRSGLTLDAFTRHRIDVLTAGLEHNMFSRRMEQLPVNATTIEVSTANIGIVCSRVSGAGLVLRGTTHLDKYNKSVLDPRSVTISRDPLGIKTPKSGQTVVDIRPASFRSLGNPLADYESQKTLGSITRGYTPRPGSMMEGFYNSQEPLVGDLPDLGRLRSSSYTPPRTGSIDMLPMSRRPDVGGVMLNTSATLEGDNGALHPGNVSLVFQNSVGVIDFTKLQRFATAMWATYLSVEGPGISIDPVSKGFREHGETHQVRYIGQVRNTDLGRVMRETDHLMKRWAVGTHRPDVDGFYSPDEFTQKLQDKPISDRPSRFWFVPEGLTFQRSSNMLLLSSGRMTCQTEYLNINPKSEKNEANELFARWLTDNYDSVAAKYPIFRDLFEYAQLVSLCTYFREHRVPMLWFLLANREIILMEDSIDEVDQLVKQSDYRWYVMIYGGVELQLDKALRNRDCYRQDPNLQEAENLLLSDSSSASGKQGPVVFSVNDTAYTVASENTLKLFSTPGEGDTIQTDLTFSDEYQESAGKREGSQEDGWRLVTPRLELVRYYNPELQTKAQFGKGWHLLVPFQLETETPSSLSNPRLLPQHVTMVNVLSGIRETLTLEKDESGKYAYVPKDKGGLAESLIRRSDGVWVLEDVLGAQFVFDPEGDLRRMTLRPDRDVSFKVGSKSHSKKISGYTVEYEYGTRSIDGRECKVLTAVKQGSHTARIDWQDGPSQTRIAAVRVLEAGQVQPVEVLNYGYDSNGMLARVSTKKGRSISVRYEDGNMRVAAAQE